MKKYMTMLKGTDQCLSDRRDGDVLKQELVHYQRGYMGDSLQQNFKHGVSHTYPILDLYGPDSNTILKIPWLLGWT